VFNFTDLQLRSAPLEVVLDGSSDREIPLEVR